MQNFIREIHVCYDPAQYEAVGKEALKGSIVVVIDVLRATSSITTALASGYKDVVPCREIEQALAEREKNPNVKLGGERGRVKIEGFDFGNSPLEVRNPPNPETRYVITTTNGTRAIAASQGADEVVILSLLNLSAVAEYLKTKTQPIYIFCSGTIDDFSLEDAIAAGALIEKLGAEHPARFIYGSVAQDLRSSLASGVNGRFLETHGFGTDIDWCSSVDKFQIVPVLRDSAIKVL